MSDSAAVHQVPNEVDQTEDDQDTREISRPTEELVFGMVGAVGAGVSQTTRVLKDILERDYGYSVYIIKASDIIRDNCKLTGSPSPSDSGANRIKDLQKVGNKLREQFEEDYVAAKAIEEIALRRVDQGGYSEVKKVPQPKSVRQVTIIDSLKHPQEVSLFKGVYGDLYWQFTIFAPEEIRENRLKRDGVEKENLSGIFTKDENDKDDFGQKVGKTAFLSDFFIRNDGENDSKIITAIHRYLELIFNITVHTPTADEAGMYTAVSAASKSACLSRQVGAAIYSSSNEQISVGWNDVPKGGGGLYSSDDIFEDHRCYKWGPKCCHNDGKKEELYQKIFFKLSEMKLLSKGTNSDQLRTALKETPIKNLIEYSRSIHAEMEAIVSASRTGKSGMVGGTLYTTTFPCHNCARHIVAAGISKVYYVEPYAKSLALDLHSDAISLLENQKEKVSFLQYEGVGPNSILKLFQHGIERKQDGAVRVIDKKTALPILPPPMDGFTTHEKRVIKRLKQVQQNTAATN